MSANNEFAARLARIEEREKTGKKREYAPLPEHPDEKPRRAKRSGLNLLLTRVLPIGVVGTFSCAYFADELSPYLPPEVIETAIRTTDIVGETLASQVLSVVEATQTAVAMSAPVTETETPSGATAGVSSNLLQSA